MLNALGVLFDELAHGSPLFLISVDLSVTMGLINSVNPAHGVLAMTGGCMCVVPTNRLGVPFLTTLPIALVVTAIIGFVLGCTLYRRLYRVSPLDQVLFSIAPIFMTMADAAYMWGPLQQPVELPETLRG